MSEAHDDVHGDGRAQLISIQTQVPGANEREWSPSDRNIWPVSSQSWHLSQAEDWYLSLGTRDSSCSSASMVTGQIWVPLMPASTTSELEEWAWKAKTFLADHSPCGKAGALFHSENQHLSWLNPTQKTELDLWRDTLNHSQQSKALP